MFDKFRPLGDRVLVKRIKEDQTTASGIIIPDAAQEKTQTGTVIAVGPGNKNTSGAVVALDVKQGDTVYFGKYAGTEATEDHLIIREDDILGIVEQ